MEEDITEAEREQISPSFSRFDNIDKLLNSLLELSHEIRFRVTAIARMQMSTVAHQHDLDAARAEIAALKERLDALERQVAIMLNEASARQTAVEIMAQPYKPGVGGTLP